ncbi:MAG TPA: ABC transporter permease [Pseudolysinimonas sp.]|jgi:ribose transport system permease protein
MSEITSTSTSRFARWAQAVLGSRYATVVVSLIALAILSPILATGSLSSSALLSMLPFAAILAVVAAGQTIIVQQAGIDLSVPGAVSLAAMLQNTIADGKDSNILLAMVISLAATVIAGVLTGLAVSWFSVTPLVATLAVNGLTLGAVLMISGGQNAIRSPNSITAFTLGQTIGVPNLVWVAAIVIAIVTFVTTRTVFGRRFVAVGVSPRAARAAGISSIGYTVAAFAIAGFCYGVAGVMLAAFQGSPSIDVGTDYLLPSIAAVVIGGTALTGGRGSIVATALGALFLTQLDRLVSGIGGPTSIQDIVQGAVILFALTLRGLILFIRNRVRRRSPAPPDDPGLPSSDESEPVLAGRPPADDDLH